MTGAEAQQSLATRTKLLYGVGNVGNLVALALSHGCYAEQVSVPRKVQLAQERAFASGLPAVVEVSVERSCPLRVVRRWAGGMCRCRFV